MKLRKDEINFILKLVELELKEGDIGNEITLENNSLKFRWSLSEENEILIALGYISKAKDILLKQPKHTPSQRPGGRKK